jgi:putative endonuclease
VAAVGPGTANRYPTAKPEGLGRELAAMAGIGPGSLVVDPFCGSGAFLVGAVERGATVVAGDVARRAVRLASARLAQASSGRGRARSFGASGQAPSGPRKLNDSRPPTTATKPTRPRKPSGPRPARPRKPGGSRPPIAATKPTRPARPGKPSRSRPPTTATKPTRPTRPHKPNGPRPARLPDTGPGTQASRRARRGSGR